MRSSAEPFAPCWFQTLVVLWSQAESRHDLSCPSTPSLHPLGTNLCTSSSWTAPQSSTAAAHLRQREVSISSPWPWVVQRCCSVADSLSLLSSYALFWRRSGCPPGLASAPQPTCAAPDPGVGGWEKKMCVSTTLNKMAVQQLGTRIQFEFKQVMERLGNRDAHGDTHNRVRRGDKWSAEAGRILNSQLYEPKETKANSRVADRSGLLRRSQSTRTN